MEMRLAGLRVNNNDNMHGNNDENNGNDILQQLPLATDKDNDTAGTSVTISAVTTNIDNKLIDEEIWIGVNIKTTDDTHLNPSLINPFPNPTSYSSDNLDDYCKRRHK